MKKAVVSVLGRDSVVIIADVCTCLAENEINILDISQTIVDGFFNMMMVVDITNVDHRFHEVIDALAEVGRRKGVEIHMQREEIFDSMHRI